jgi:murein DD-endopeptidase MepM/ murein hydrolase activator NlpD
VVIPIFVLLLGLVAPSCWPAPVDLPVVRGFEAPACTWCAGHRGVEYRPSPGTPIRAVAAGQVVFAGPVAGVMHVTEQLPDGRKVTYAFVRRALVREGDQVQAGAVVALSSDRLLLSVRVGQQYLDPAPLLARVVGRPRLLPTDGTRPRPGPMPRFACATRESGR